MSAGWVLPNSKVPLKLSRLTGIGSPPLAPRPPPALCRTRSTADERRVGLGTGGGGGVGTGVGGGGGATAPGASCWKAVCGRFARSAAAAAAAARPSNSAPLEGGGKGRPSTRDGESGTISGLAAAASGLREGPTAGVVSEPATEAVVAVARGVGGVRALGDSGGAASLREDTDDSVAEGGAGGHPAVVPASVAAGAVVPVIVAVAELSVPIGSSCSESWADVATTGGDRGTTDVAPANRDEGRTVAIAGKDDGDVAVVELGESGVAAAACRRGNLLAWGPWGAGSTRAGGGCPPETAAEVGAPPHTA